MAPGGGGDDAVAGIDGRFGWEAIENVGGVGEVLGEATVGVSDLFEPVVGAAEDRVDEVGDVVGVEEVFAGFIAAFDALGAFVPFLVGFDAVVEVAGVFVSAHPILAGEEGEQADGLGWGVGGSLFGRNALEEDIGLRRDKGGTPSGVRNFDFGDGVGFDSRIVGDRCGGGISVGDLDFVSIRPGDRLNAFLGIALERRSAGNDDFDFGSAVSGWFVPNEVATGGEIPGFFGDF